jgi:hypothetical protein
MGANPFRVVLAAARPLWGLDQVERRPGLTLRRSRPWDRQKAAPRPLNVVWTCRAALHEAGVCPIPRCSPALADKHEEPKHALPGMVSG